MSKANTSCARLTLTFAEPVEQFKWVKQMQWRQNQKQRLWWRTWVMRNPQISFLVSSVPMKLNGQKVLFKMMKSSWQLSPSPKVQRCISRLELKVFFLLQASRWKWCLRTNSVKAKNFESSTLPKSTSRQKRQTRVLTPSSASMLLFQLIHHKNQS